MKKKYKAPDYLIQTITQYILFFFLGAIIGYLWEVSLMFMLEGKLYNRGFLYGPWLPVYGVGTVLMLLALRRFQRRPLLVFVLAALLGSVVELCIGWLLEQFWGLRYWDYRSLPLNLNGYICLYSALAFGVAGTLWICVLARLASHLWRKIPERGQSILLTLIILAFLLDCAISLICPNTGSGISTSQP